MKMFVFAICAMLPSCARAPLSSTVPSGTTTTSSADLERHEDARTSDDASDSAALERNATEVFRAMHPDLLRCFTRSGRATTTIRVEVIVGLDGAPQSVEATPRSPLSDC